MAFTAAPGLLDERAIDIAIRNVEQAFSPDVVRIAHSFADDASGCPSIFFRVLVRDEAAPANRLLELSRRLTIALMNGVDVDDIGMHAYFNYRSVSEQKTLQDPAWN